MKRRVRQLKQTYSEARLAWSDFVLGMRPYKRSAATSKDQVSIELAASTTRSLTEPDPSLALRMTAAGSYRSQLGTRNSERLQAHLPTTCEEVS